MARKQMLLDLLQQGHDEEKLFYDGLSSKQRAQKGEVDNWAAKDVIAHINYWKQMRMADIRRVLVGGTPTEIEDFDHENAQIFEKFSERTWVEIMAYAEESTAAMRDQLNKMSEADLEVAWRDDQPIWRVFFGNGYSHPLIHIAGHFQAQGDFRRAGELTGMLGQPVMKLDDSPAWRGLVHYNSACSYALWGDKKEAIDQLAQALSIRPNMAEWSKQDPDLDPLRSEPAYLALYENED